MKGEEEEEDDVSGKKKKEINYEEQVCKLCSSFLIHQFIIFSISYQHQHIYNIPIYYNFLPAKYYYIFCVCKMLIQHSILIPLLLLSL